MQSNGRMLLGSSFTIWSFCGVAFLASYWQAMHRPEEALIRSLVFLALLAVVHVIAIILYERQNLPSSSSILWRFTSGQSVESETRTFDNSTSENLLLNAIKFSIALQIPVLILGALLLDGGRMLRIFTIGALAHWLLIGLISLRKPQRLTKLDLLLVRYGFLLMCFLVIPISRAVFLFTHLR